MPPCTALRCAAAAPFAIRPCPESTPWAQTDPTTHACAQCLLEVMSRGGYEAITQARAWADLARVMGFDPTLAGYPLRVHYERYLLSWEEYMTGGQYELDAASGNLPPGNRLLDVMPGTAQNSERAAAPAERAGGCSLRGAVKGWPGHGHVWKAAAMQ